jgi:hypothetical protein
MIKQKNESNFKNNIMIKRIFPLMMLAIMSCGESKEEKKEQAVEKPTEALPYGKDDLKKIKWIEGKWKGLYKGDPFYEIYRFINDSTLESIGYDWNGKDSSNTKKSYVYFKDGVYYLGEKQNYKVVSITETEIKMVPNVDAHNDVLWKYRDSTGWDAVLKGTKETNIYNMQHFDPFNK